MAEPIRSKDDHQNPPPSPTRNGYPDPSPSRAQPMHYGGPSRPTTTNANIVVVYKECLKNHAAKLGGAATDGCGEFMPSTAGGGGGLLCSACGCHRNFHRKEVIDGDAPTARPYLRNCHSSWTIPTNTHHYNHQVAPQRHPNNGVIMTAKKCGPHDDEEVGPAPPLLEGDHQGVEGVNKKRYRTKFTKEQKEKMLGFAEKAGWKIQKLEEGLVQQFCQEVGIKRRVLKVWMHNNKHHFVQKIALPNNHINVNDDSMSHNTSSNFSDD